MPATHTHAVRRQLCGWVAGMVGKSGADGPDVARDRAAAHAVEAVRHGRDRTPWRRLHPVGQNGLVVGAAVGCHATPNPRNLSHSTGE
jgi:hypothetical protein